MSADNQFNTVRDALGAGKRALDTSSSSARLDAEMLLALTLGKDRAWLYGHPDDPLTGKAAGLFRTLLAERARGIPVAHLTGTREFWSLELNVNEHTLVPRPETEILVEQALEKIPTAHPSRVLDLGTGSGAIAIAVARERPHAVVVATDASKAALSVAAENADRHCPGRIRLAAGSWFAAVTDEMPFDVIVSNPPYIAADETELTDPELAHEPVDALYSGAGGLDAIQHIIAAAPAYLVAGGWLLLEHGFEQADAVARLLEAADFDSVDNVHDLADRPRVSAGRKP